MVCFPNYQATDKKVHILIAHHQEKMRSALTFLLSQETNFQVVSDASNPEELIKNLKSTQPDVVLLDCNLFDKPLADQVAGFQEQVEDLRVVVLCSGAEKENLLPTGNYTFVDITEHPRRLITALRVLELEEKYE